MSLTESHPEYPRLNEPNVALFAIHDLKGAAHAIQGFLSVLRGEQAGPLTAIQHDFVSSAFITARRIERLVDDLQVFEFANRTLSLIPGDCDLLSIIRMCVRELEPTSIGFNAEIEILADPKGIWDLVADPVRIEQIVFNLIENAIRYSEAHSTIIVRLKQSPTRLLLVVENTIVDPAAFDVDLSFQPFQRGEWATRFGRRGLGLGLTVVETLAAMHGGSVCARSRAKTVSIAVTLPRRRSPVGASVAPD